MPCVARPRASGGATGARSSAVAHAADVADGAFGASRKQGLGDLGDFFDGEGFGFGPPFASRPPRPVGDRGLENSQQLFLQRAPIDGSATTQALSEVIRDVLDG